MDGYIEERFTAGDITRPVFRKGQGYGVVLIHELPGLTAETCDLAEYIISRGFHVAMPLLFGKPLQSATVGLAQSSLLCLRKEFHCFSSGKSSPITSWLKALCRKLHADCGGRGVGAIGMCFTGGFVLSIMVDPSVAAPVAAQPTLPLLNPSAVDADRETLAQAKARAENAPLLALRFADDGRCKEARFKTLNEAFCGDETRCQRFAQVVVPGKGHSTLTFDYQAALARGHDTRSKVVEHLRRLLAPQ
jgi:dienelactone hydrolase